MIFHEQLFKNKGWGSSRGYLKVTTISVIRSDKIASVQYCKNFYQGLVLTLDKLNLKRTSDSLDLCEKGCLIVQNEPKDILSAHLNNKIQFSNKPFFFYGEKSPSVENSLNKLTSFLSLKYKIDSYVIALFDKETKDTFFTVKSKGKKDTQFKLRNSSNMLEEI